MATCSGHSSLNLFAPVKLPSPPMTTNMEILLCFWGEGGWKKEGEREKREGGNLE